MDGRAPATHAAAGAGGTEPNGGQQSMAQATHPLRLGAVRAAPARRPPSNHHIPIVRAREGGGGSRRRGRTTALVMAAAVSKERTSATGRAAEVVREFYEGVNRRDLAAVAPLIAEGCVYEDLVFPRPMVGRDQVMGFFGEFMGSVSPDLRFVIDDISGEDPSAVGVTWHLEWKGRPFPFSRGCSFYRCQPDPNQQDRIQIVYGRDCVEPATKPGELALVAIRGVTWILERFPSLADRL